MPSTVIQRYLYDPATQVLTITFVTGRVYAYEDVPASVYQAFQAAPSKGVFFNAEIREHFPFRKLDRVQPRRAAAEIVRPRTTRDKT